MIKKAGFLLITGVFLSGILKAQKCSVLKEVNPELNSKVKADRYLGGVEFFSYYSLYLNSDSTFFYFSGIEQYNNMYLGKWEKKENEIILNHKKISEFNLIRSVALSNGKDNDSTVFYILDKTGLPLKNFEIISPDKTEKNIPAIFITDTLGKAKINVKAFDKLEFYKLEVLSKKKYSFCTKNLPDTVTIVINLNAEILYNSQQKIEYSKKAFKFIRSGERLISDNLILNLTTNRY